MPSGDTGHQLARDVREQFARRIGAVLPRLSATAGEFLEKTLHGSLRGLPVTPQEALEAPRAFDKARQQWEQAARRHWLQVAHGGSLLDATPPTGDDQLELVDDIVVEGKILAARLGSSINEAVAGIWAQLQIRMQRLEYSGQLASDDPLRAEVFVRCLLIAWRECGLSQPVWTLVQKGLKPVLIQTYEEAYAAANDVLFEAGIPAELDLKARVRRTLDPAAASTAAGSFAGSAHEPSWGRTTGGAKMTAAHAAVAGGHGGLTQAPAEPVNAYRAQPIWSRSLPMPASARHDTGLAHRRFQEHATALAEQQYGRLSLAWALRQRPQELWTQLEGLLAQQVPGYAAATTRAAGLTLSPALVQALAEPATQFIATEAVTGVDGMQDAALAAAEFPVGVLAHRLRQRANALKSRAEKPNERAVIEVVALMFQAILAEDSIAAGIKVWFARLQVPVLRIALNDPDFFTAEEHPTRQLIDRMGGCAMGLDAASVPTDPLESEIQRIVRIIEQYPDIGGRVFGVMLREFEKFLEGWLTDSEPMQRATSLAQRVEQREALVVQYSIELAHRLKTLPVSEAVRQFLFQVWSDVLAVAAVRSGAHHADTQRFKVAATELIRATSVQPDRQRRTQMMQGLASLLALLREGMRSVGLAESAQEEHIRQLKDAVLLAFQGKGEGLSSSQLTQFAQALDTLEDVVSDDPEGDMMLDPGVIELMFGEDSAAVITVIDDGGEPPTPEVLAAVRELPRGGWFTLDFDGQATHVQYVWRSQRGQLHLFATGGQKTFLVQTQRLAGFFQGGLITPVAAESLMLKATREALTRLQEAPEELLQ